MRSRIAVAVTFVLLLALAAGLLFRLRAAEESVPDKARPTALKPSDPVKPEANTGGGAPRDPGVQALVKRRISGRVLQHDGAPAGGHTVILGRSQNPGILRVAQVEAGADGAFRFEDLQPVKHVVAVLDGQVSRQVDLEMQDVEGIELRLPAFRTITATVVDARGAAVAGARVALPWEPGRPSALTDILGVARLTAFSESLYVAVVETPAGERDYILPLEKEIKAGEDTVFFVLPHAGIATGVVLAPGGRPLPSVTLLTSRDDFTVSTTQTDAQGRFRARVPLDGEVSLVVDSGDGFAEIRETPDAEPLRVTGRLDGVRAGDHDLELRLVAVPRDCTLNVRVESPAGTAVAGAAVELIDDSGTLASGTTDAAGLVSFKNLYDSQVLVQAKRPAANPAAADWLTGLVYRVTPAGQELVVRLAAGYRISGVVLRPDGEPCAGAIVCTSIRRQDAVPVTVGADGRFEFLVDPADPDMFDLVAWGQHEGKKLAAGTGRVDPRNGPFTIRLKAQD